MTWAVSGHGSAILHDYFARREAPGRILGGQFAGIDVHEEARNLTESTFELKKGP